MQRTVFPSIIGVTACAILAAWAVGMFSAPSATTNAADDHIPPGVMERFTQHRADIVNSNPHAIFTLIFELAGHDAEEAVSLATKVYEHFFDEEAVARLDWVRSNHHAVFTQAYEITGHDPEDAVILANNAMIFLSGELPPSPDTNDPNPYGP